MDLERLNYLIEHTVRKPNEFLQKVAPAAERREQSLQDAEGQMQTVEGIVLRTGLYGRRRTIVKRRIQ